MTTQLASGVGSLGGDLTARDTDIPNTLASLDQLAYTISTRVNAQNNAGGLPAQIRRSRTRHRVLDNRSKLLDIFWLPTQHPAAQTLSGRRRRDECRDDRSESGSGGRFGAGNGRQLKRHRHGHLTNRQNPSKHRDPTTFFSNPRSEKVRPVSNVQTENTAQTASVSQLQSQNNAISSVNLNDEASAPSERSYQAASARCSRH